MKNTYLLDVLKDQVTPALGCTEPIAVALAVAKAKETLGSFPDKIKIKVDRNIFKNALAVGIPGTRKKDCTWLWPWHWWWANRNMALKY